MLSRLYISRIPILFFFLLFIQSEKVLSQCTTIISSFPYTEDFESSNGNWVHGGTGDDWAWGTPSKPVINAAGSGLKCWVIGGLTNSSYNNSEASWLMSPCFDFTNIDNPYIQFKVIWEMERKYDGANLQYSLDNGTTWTNIGAASDAANCLTDNWYNYTPITYLASLATVKDGWSGNIQTTSGSCQGGGGSGTWVLAKHAMPDLAGKPSVKFRFTFGAGSLCNSYDGFAIDDIYIGEAPSNQASFSYSCVNSNTVSFSNTSSLCPTQFYWDFGDPASGANNSSSNANPSHIFSSPGTYTVSFTVSGPANASSVTTQTISILSTAVSVVTPIKCNRDNNGSLQATVNGTTNSLSYEWNTTPVQTGTIATGLSAGEYTVNVSANNSCPSSATYVLTEPVTFSNTATITQSTCNNSNGTISVTVNGGTPPYSYTWSPAGGNNSMATNLAAGVYTLGVTDNHGCQYSIPVTLTDLNAPSISVQTVHNVSCFNGTDGSITTVASGGNPPYNYSWSPAGGVAAIASGLVSGDYTLTVTDQSGCSDIENVSVSEPSALQIEKTITDATCELNNGAIELMVNGGTPAYTYQWTPSVSSESSVSDLAAGNYTILITDQNGCSFSESNIQITNTGMAANVNLGPDTTICAGETLLLNAGVNENYIWQDGSGLPTLSVSQPGKYWVTVSNSSGCMASDTINIKVNPACNDIYFPTAFTPNGDSKNETFGPIGNITAVTNYRFIVYNRWGQVVFSSTNPAEKWNGKIKGLDPGTNVFVWFARYSFDGAPEKTKKGTVLLIK